MKEPGKPRGKPFVKGDPRAGRPLGSKSGSTVCKEWADKFGFDFLMRVAQGTEVVNGNRPAISLRVEVAEYLIDRAYGKPTAMLDVDVTARVTLAQLVAASRVDPKSLPIDASASR